MTEPEKMGFEKRFRPEQSYGSAGWITVAGRECYTASGAERQWLRELELAIVGGQVKEWQWQPKEVEIHFKRTGIGCVRTYRPDCRVVWNSDEGEVWYEIKYNRIEQQAGTNVIRFCQQHPDKKMVLVWKGPRPNRSGTTKKKFDAIVKLVDHVWYLKK
jgi:hypothetical protein